MAYATYTCGSLAVNVPEDETESAKINALETIQRLIDQEVGRLRETIARAEQPPWAVGQTVSFTYLGNQTRSGRIEAIRFDSGQWELLLVYRGQDRRTVRAWYPARDCWSREQFRKVAEKKAVVKKAKVSTEQVLAAIDAI